jgi:general stress protein 26
MNSELAKMYGLIEEMDTAILVTRRADGHMVARPMACQADAPGADLWFVSSEGTGKLEDLESDTHVKSHSMRAGSRSGCRSPA